jgi:hypothetical protein
LCWDGFKKEGGMTEDEAQLYGALTAFQFMLENLYAMCIYQDGGTVEDVRRTRDEMLRQFEELPARNASPSDDQFMVIQHGLARLERMWDVIESRVAQGPR